MPSEVQGAGQVDGVRVRVGVLHQDGERNGQAALIVGCGIAVGQVNVGDQRHLAGFKATAVTAGHKGRSDTPFRHREDCGSARSLRAGSMRMEGECGMREREGEHGGLTCRLWLLFLDLGLPPGGRPEEGVPQQLGSRGSVVRVWVEAVHDEDLGGVRHALRDLGVDLEHAHLEGDFLKGYRHGQMKGNRSFEQLPLLDKRSQHEI